MAEVENTKLSEEELKAQALRFFKLSRQIGWTHNKAVERVMCQDGELMLILAEAVLILKRMVRDTEQSNPVDHMLLPAKIKELVERKRSVLDRYRNAKQT